MGTRGGVRRDWGREGGGRRVGLREGREFGRKGLGQGGDKVGNRHSNTRYRPGNQSDIYP